MKVAVTAVIAVCLMSDWGVSRAEDDRSAHHPACWHSMTSPRRAGLS